MLEKNKMRRNKEKIFQSNKQNPAQFYNKYSLIYAMQKNSEKPL